MIRYGRRHWVLATCLSTLAGYVDAVGFLESGGLFVSFMSGNSTRLAVGLVDGAQVAAAAFGVVGAFVAGVVAGALIGHRAQARRPQAVLAGVAVFLAFAAAAGPEWPVAGLALMAAAMGLENGVFQRDGEVSIGVTYMTGTLVKFGQRLAGALTGGARLAWAPYLMLWVGLVCGAVVVAATHGVLKTGALWVAAAAALALAALATWTSPVGREAGAS